MPWHVAKSAECPASKPWAVIKDSDGSVVGCHETEADAEQQKEALYANEESLRPPTPGRTLSAMLHLRQTDDGWEVLDSAGTVLASFDGPAADDGAQRRAYALAVQWLADNAPLAPAVPPDGTPEAPTPNDTAPDTGEAPPGALAERWQSGPQGIVANAPTGDGRDFTDTVWTWRAATAPLPLLMLTENDYGHFGAEVCGWIDTTGDPTAPGSVGGWFHDTDTGRTARDVLRAQGAFPVSVDPGAVEATFMCTEEIEDDWGSFCVDGILTFQAYEIAGLTMVPFPGFATAAIELVPAAAPSAEVIPVTPSGPDAVGDGVTAALHPDVAAHVKPRPVPVEATEQPATAPLTAAAPLRPPGHWFELSEPPSADPRWVEQRDGQRGVPLTITDDGQVYGHLGLWGTCHTGMLGECTTPPVSDSDYAHFHLGLTRTEDGRDVPTGCLSAGCDHAALRMRAPEATDWYAHNGVPWADVRASNGEAGVWVAGALRPDVTEEQVRVLRAGSLSGDWRDRGGKLQLIAALAVPYPGFPVLREALAASGFPVFEGTPLGWAMGEGRQMALVASGVLRPADSTLAALVAAGTVESCPSCGRARRTVAARAEMPAELLSVLRVLGESITGLRRTVDVLELRTRPARKVAAAEARERLSANSH